MHRSCVIICALGGVVCEAAKKVSKKKGKGPPEPEVTFNWKLWGLVAWCATVAVILVTISLNSKKETGNAGKTGDAPETKRAPSVSSWETRADRGSVFHISGTSTRN